MCVLLLSEHILTQADVKIQPVVSQGTSYSIFLCLAPFAPEKLVSQNPVGRPVPRQPTHSSNPG